MTTTNNNAVRACNDACALNNVGVHLMVQGHFEGAASTLKDALTVMRATLQSANQPIHQDAEALLQFSQRRMQSATRRLSGLSEEERQQQQQQCCGPLPFQLTLIESNDFDALKNLATAPADSATFTAVLIRDTCTQASQQEREWAIILLNYALACFFLTAVTTDRRKQEQFSAICYKSLVMAQQTFAPDAHQDPVEQVERVFWTLLSLTSLAQCMRAYQQHAKAQEAEQTRKTLLTAVLSHEHHRRISFSSDHLVAAAA